MKRRYCEPKYPMPVSTRRQRMDDAIDRDIARSRRNTPPAANAVTPAQEQPVEGEKQNG